MEEAAAYQQLIDDFGLSQDAVAQRVGKSRSTITNALRLLQLPASVQHFLLNGSITAGHARAITGFPYLILVLSQSLNQSIKINDGSGLKGATHTRL